MIYQKLIARLNKLIFFVRNLSN